jgi:hypothetical protein
VSYSEYFSLAEVRDALQELCEFPVRLYRVTYRHPAQGSAHEYVFAVCEPHHRDDYVSVVLGVPGSGRVRATEAAARDAAVKHITAFDAPHEHEVEELKP